MIFLNILFIYILPTIYDSAIALILVLFFLFIFRVKDPNIRIAFFFIPLIKPFITIYEKIDVNSLYSLPRLWSLGIRFFNPAAFTIPINIQNISPINLYILAMVVLHFLIFFIIKWLHVAFLYRKLAAEEKPARTDIPELYSMLDDFADKIKVKPPDICLTHKYYYAPFIIGIKKTMLVFSPQLLECLSYSEKQTLVQHEISHIKRKDNLIGWIALILKDLIYFNPFGYIAYSLIRAEQERGSDLLVLKYSEKKPETIAADILNSIMKLKKINQENKIITHNYSSNFFTEKICSRRLRHRIENILSAKKYKINSRIAPKILLYILFLFLLVMQIFLVINIHGYIVILK
jgi:beta-lactamase regulating signal transducer with metallopeptidase domain